MRRMRRRLSLRRGRLPPGSPPEPRSSSAGLPAIPRPTRPPADTSEWHITVVDATHFSLQDNVTLADVAGNGAYTGGGTVTYHPVAPGDCTRAFTDSAAQAEA